MLTTLDFSALLRFHRESGALATLAVHPRETPIDLQVVRFNGGGRIAAYTENPSVSHMAFMGVSVLEPEVLGYIQPGECLDFPGLVQRLLAAGCQVGGFPFEGYWMDLSRPADYAQATHDFDSIRDQFKVHEPRTEAQSSRTQRILFKKISSSCLFIKFPLRSLLLCGYIYS